MKAMVAMLAMVLVAVGWAQSGGPKPPGGGGGSGAGAYFTLQGRVTDAKGQAVMGAVVKATSRNTATTDGSGSYMIPELPKTGTYNVSVSKPGLLFSPDRVQVRPPAGMMYTLNFQAKDPKAK